MSNKMHHLTKVGYLVGFSWLIMATWRWWFLYHDVSTLILADGIGIGILIFSYIYNWMRNKDEEFTLHRANMNDRLDNLHSGIREVNPGWI